MALLTGKKNIAEKKVSKKTAKLAVVVDKKPAVVSTAASSLVDLSGVIIRPRITEKVTLLGSKDRNVVAFDVSAKANKRNVAEMVKRLYKVTAVKVAVLKVPQKKSVVRGRETKGKTNYKAYVYLKKGDTIEVI